MIGWVRVNQGKRKTTYYVVIPWDRMDGYGEKKKWHFKYDKRGDKFDSKRHAERFLEYLRTLIDEKTFNPLDWVEKKPHAFEELVPLYLQDYEKNVQKGEISPSTLAVKKRYMDNYFMPFLRGQDVKRIIALTLKQFYNQLPFDLKAKTRLNIMSELNTFLTWAEEEGVISKAPRFTGVNDLKKQAKKERPPVREATHWMPDDDFELALSHMDEWDRPIFWLIRLTGCRPSEARALQRSDFDWKSGVFEILRTWVDASGGEVLVGAKSGSERALAITEMIEEVVKSVLPRLDTPFVFHPKGQIHYTRRQLDYRWRTALKKAGLPHMELKNATRASLVCEALRLGYTYEEIGAVVGHKHTSTTRYYGTIFVEQTAGLLERRTKKRGTKSEPKLKIEK